MFSESFYARLAARVGRSAATTYMGLRENNQTAKFALAMMRKQLAELGAHYSGGLACVPYRKARQS